MNRLLLVAALVTVTLTPTLALAQEAGTNPEILDQAIALNDAEGPAATLEFLENAQAEADLPLPAKALLGALLLAAGRAGDAYAILEPLSRLEDAPPALLFNAWRAAAATGQGPARVDLLERAAQLDPISPAARELGLIRGRQGRLQEAYVLLGGWARAFPNDVEARLAAAHSALQLRRVPEAEGFLSDLPQEIPQVRLLLGKILFHRGDPYGAVATLSALGDGSELPPGMDLDRRKTLANAYIAIGQGAEAADLLADYAGDDPGMILVLVRAQAQSGDVAAALETIRPIAETVQQDPSQVSPELGAGILLQYGRQLIATGSHEAAVAPLQVATTLQPDNEMIWQPLGQALAVAGRREEATAALERFNALAQNAVPETVQQAQLERDVDDPTGRQLREALKLAGRDRPAEGLEVARNERLLSPGDPRVPMVESQILVRLDLLQDALVAAQDAIDLAPDYADTYYQRAVVLMSLQRLDAAESDFRKAIELAADHVAAMNDLAVLLMYQERNDEARQLLEKVLELSPDDALAASNLAQLEG